MTFDSSLRVGAPAKPATADGQTGHDRRRHARRLRMKRAENSSGSVRPPSASDGEGAPVSAHLALASADLRLSNHTEREGSSVVPDAVPTSAPTDGLEVAGTGLPLARRTLLIFLQFVSAFSQSEETMRRVGERRTRRMLAENFKRAVLRNPLLQGIKSMLVRGK